MVEKTIDARGLSCPEPVLLVMQAINDITGGTIEVKVDTATSRENVTRMAKSQSCTVEATELDNDNIVLHVKKG